MAPDADKVLDYALLKRAVEGDPDAQGVVVDKVLTTVYLTLGREHPRADDAASDALRVISAKFDTFKPQNENGGKTAKASTWVGEIAWRTALAHRRKEVSYRRRYPHIEDESNLDAGSTSLDETAEEEAARERFEHALASGEVDRLLGSVMDLLGDDHRDVLILSVVFEFTVAEVAKALGLGHEQAKARIRRARAKLVALVASPPERLRRDVDRLRELAALSSGAMETPVAENSPRRQWRFWN